MKQDPHLLFIGGLLCEEIAAPKHAVSVRLAGGRATYFFPQRDDRFRLYVIYHRDVLATRLQGPGDLPRFFQMALQAGTPAEWLSGARAAGPLATFEGADVWVEHPYRDGVVLVGDAAATSDPSWGQGLSLSLRDVRTLRDKLLASDDWDRAGHAYAEEHDRYYGILHLVEDWSAKLFLEVGSDADARRAKMLPLNQADPRRIPDVFFSGPSKPLDEADRIRFIGE